MAGVWEHIDDSRSLQPVAMFGHESIQVPGQGSRMTGDIHNSRGSDTLDVPNHFQRAASGRIQQLAGPAIP